MNKFDLFLQQINFKEKIELVKVKVNTNIQRWTFVMQLDKVIDPRILTQLISQLEVMFKVNPVKEIDYEFIFKDENLEEYALEFYKFIVNKASENTPSLSIFKSYEPKYDKNTYHLKIESDAGIVSRRAPELKKKFKKFGITNVNFAFEIDFDKSVNKQLEAQIKDDSRTAISRIEKPEVIINERKVFQHRNGANKISIIDIPKNQYELDKYINENGISRPNFIIEGTVFKIEKRNLPNTTLAIMTVADLQDAIVVKFFINKKQDEDIIDEIKTGDTIRIQGSCVFDTYDKDIVIMARSINMLERSNKDVRLDRHKEKRVEFHIHTKMSTLDGVTTAAEYIDRLEQWKYPAAAFVDHQGVYAYPEIANAVRGKKIKPIYGVEFEYADIERFKITNETNTDFELQGHEYVVFDIETTGLSVEHHKIIEISGYKVKNGIIGEQFQTFVNPNEPLSLFIKEFTGIKDEDLANAPNISKALKDFYEFSKGCALVAHNGFFDYDFLVHHGGKNNLDFSPFPLIDTLALVKVLNPDMKRINLKAVARKYKIRLDNHHRAEEDARALAEIFVVMLRELYEAKVETFKGLNRWLDPNEVWKYVFTNHITILTKKQSGLKNLYKIVSNALTNNYFNFGRVTNISLKENREGLLIGSSCASGIVFETALNKGYDALLKEMELFDYIEVQPPSALRHLYEMIGNNGKEIVEATIKKIIDAANELNKIVIATSDAHYLDPSDKKYREVFIKGKGLGQGRHPLFRAENTPNQHLYTTEEMLDEFAFLGSDLAKKIVIENTINLNKKIEYVEAFPKDLYSIPDDAFSEKLGIKSAEEEVVRLVWEKASSMYGQDVHKIVKDRINKELESIIQNKFAPIYYISHLLVQKSLEDGYLVGSRGSVGSSLVATLLDITEVNPLRPHYYCPNNDFQTFKMSEDEIFKYGIREEEASFIELTSNVNSGYDLKDATCPHCGSPLKKDGHDIPFETFLGFKGDKVPDIDLNFSGDYQSTAHAYVRDLLGEDYTFRAGTIQTIAERNALGYAKGYYESVGEDVRWAQVERLAIGLEGVRRSTGQHPGGIVVVPKNKTIYDVTPIQYPADDVTSEWKTTHFDYHSIEDNLLKLDILGHDDPTVIKFLMDYVLKHPEDFPFSKAQDIPLDDPKVYQLFTNPKIVDIINDDLYGDIASYGLPEFGTGFTRQILRDTQPNTFAGLVKISGLSHGTDVWLKNSQDLVLGKTEFGKIPFDSIIGCRDDIMVQLAEYGMPDDKAFEIMEFVRRGLPSRDVSKWAKYEKEMRSFGVDPWYIWSASQIKYMFPKAHATAYVIMAMRIAWFKLYNPLLFYSAFFSKRSTQFDYEAMVAGTNAIRNKILEINKSARRLTATEESLLTTLYVAYEMSKRGFRFYPLDIETSTTNEFTIKEDGLLMPFSTIDGFGSKGASDLVSAREERGFTSKADVRIRGKVNKTVFDKFELYGAMDNLPEEDELPTFDLFS